ncbi:MAG: alpha/beta fold hydrolase [Cyanobacteria bacterium P01_B01_bin.77]
MQILWCLHGNLQQPTVWGNLAKSLATPTLQVKTLSLWDRPADSCWAWADAFCQHVSATTSKPAAETQNYLLGYSLGGRLALHGLLTQPDLWSGAIIVSAAPGIADAQQKERCLKRDRTWANRFLTEPWQPLLTEWDALSVFCDRTCPTPRPESAFDRQKIAHAFEAYSKGHMDDLTYCLKALTLPITYITGSDDQRYGQLGQSLQAKCPSLTHREIADAGHRVPWEQPEAFLHILNKCL